jgi:hypothetical protein
VFTVIVLFVAAIVYTALSARITVERETGFEALLERERSAGTTTAEQALHAELASVVNAAAHRLEVEQTALDARLAQSADVLTQR